jgi:hypothetical protein
MARPNALKKIKWIVYRDMESKAAGAAFTS